MLTFIMANKCLTLLVMIITVLLYLVVHFTLAAIWPCGYGDTSHSCPNALHVLKHLVSRLNKVRKTFSFYTNFDYTIYHENLDVANKYQSEFTLSRSGHESTPCRINYCYTDILQYCFKEACNLKNYISLLLILLAILIFSLNNFKQTKKRYVYLQNQDVS